MKNIRAKKLEKIILLSIVSIFSFCMFSCSSKVVKSDITPTMIEEAYSRSNYLTWSHQIKEDNDIYKYNFEIKVYNSLNEQDYIFIYFFDNSEVAKEYEETNASKSSFILYLFSWIFGNPTKFNLTRYDYMIVESYDNQECKSKDDMIKIFENVIYE